MSRGSAPRWAAGGLLLLVTSVTASSACVTTGYPLPKGGTVQIVKDVAGDLYATATFTEAGAPVNEVRQKPYETGVNLTITEGAEPAFGAFVFVRVEPAQALQILSDPAEPEGDKTCEEVDGTFRCMATEEGTARFLLRSVSDWSGPAVIRATWADTGNATAPITVNPPGLPIEATNFELILGNPTDKILARFTGLECTLGPVDNVPAEKWRPGKIRAVEAYVRATPPSNAPTVVENAPVLIESLSTEAALSLTEDCADRESRLPQLLRADGESDKFYVCFSDIGGENVRIAFSSGQHSGDQEPEPTILDVEPEPRLLRVTTLKQSIGVGETAALYEIAAYDANRDAITMDVDLLLDTTIIEVDELSVTLSGSAGGIIVDGRGLVAGTTTLHVRPLLLDSPDCSALEVTVE